MRILCVLFVVTLLVTGCGGGSPTSPEGPRYPTVAGSYSGTTTMSFPELLQSVTCATSTSVTQSGANVSIAPLVLGGVCGGSSIPFGSVTIDTNGALLGQNSGTYNDPSCGTYNVTGSGGFFGRDLRLSISAGLSHLLQLQYDGNVVTVRDSRS